MSRSSYRIPCAVTVIVFLTSLPLLAEDKSTSRSDSLVAEVLRLNDDLRNLRTERVRMREEIHQAEEEMLEYRILMHTGVDLVRADRAKTLLRSLKLDQSESAFKLVEAEIKLAEFDESQGTEDQHKQLVQQKENAQAKHELATENYRLAKSRLAPESIEPQVAETNLDDKSEAASNTPASAEKLARTIVKLHRQIAAQESINQKLREQHKQVLTKAKFFEIRRWEPEVNDLENLERFDSPDYDGLAEDVESLRRQRRAAMMPVIEVEKQIVALDASIPNIDPTADEIDERLKQEVARAKAQRTQLVARMKALQGEYDVLDAQYRLVKRRLAELDADD